ncbi:MAG: regulatory protein RecX [Gammaproteobacteria bacterium]|nr:regulatory protein RecX [Gammaproteobacteria bacterium]
MDLLARREHSTGELRTKLRAKGFDDEESVDLQLGRLRDEGLLSDERFVEAFAHGRRLRGQGPLRIAAELRERAVPAVLIEAYVDQRDRVWTGIAREARRKRFGQEAPAELAERARQARFLRYRGFTEDQIKAAFSSGDDF